ncbi:uracil-DNA glycosylase [Bacillus massiliigorillae]|uniref:uracil-DNA glycosylase n=1 Tax=Bacillus massiliigorillae TaxID=1243664 RepID=UPI0003A36917|nr:uracil-DNA glycosylase [Bacillus massiliigorillae]
MKIPEELAELGRKRIEGHAVEGFVYGSGPKQPKLMLVGEAPGETEIGNGIPFSGRAGQKLMEFLEGLGLTREDVYITSAVRSRPYKWREKRNRQGEVEMRKYNRPPTIKEIIAHAPIIDYEIQHVEAPIIVTLGNVGLQRLVGKSMKVTEVHGQFLQHSVLHIDENDTFQWSKDKYLLFPTFHPASVFYNPKLRELVASDQQRLKDWLQKQ